MPGRPIFAIVNPCAAYSAASRLWPQILQRLKMAGFDVVPYFTRHKFHAMDIARSAVQEGAELVVCVGGDGTFNEVINGLLDCGYKHRLPELAVIPLGTGTDLARTLKIPKDYERAIEIVKNGRPKKIDVGKATFNLRGKQSVRYFANVFDAGLGGCVVRISNAMPKNLGGFFTFLLSSIAALLIFKRPKFKIWLDRKFVDEGLITIIGAANGQYFGGGMHIAPMALVDDGNLEILYVKDTNMFKFLTRVLFKVYQAGHLSYKNVPHYQGRLLKIKTDRICVLDFDGEMEKADEVEISIVPGAIRVRVPA